jgi:hypothetical protein
MELFLIVINLLLDIDLVSLVQPDQYITTDSDVDVNICLKV